MDDVLTVEGLTKTFGSTRANDAIDLKVRPGEVVGLLGHNGAGKTTLVSQVSGLMRPDSGVLRVAGVDVMRRPGVARRALALQPQSQVPLEGLTPRSAIEIAARLRGSSRLDAKRTASTLIEDLDIGAWERRRAGAEDSGLSGGVRRLTAFAMAVAAPVPLVILDEPTNDVDASRRRLLWSKVRRIADDGAGVLLVTHNVTEAEFVMDRLLVMEHGQVAAAGTPAELRGALADGLRLDVTSGGTDSDLVPSFETLGVGRTGHRLQIHVPHHEAARAVNWAKELHEAEVIEQFALTPMSLEDVYLAVTAGEGTAIRDHDAFRQEPTHA